MSTGGEVANAQVCKTCIRGFDSRPVLQRFKDAATKGEIKLSFVLRACFINGRRIRIVVPQGLSRLRKNPCFPDHFAFGCTFSRFESVPQFHFGCRFASAGRFFGMRRHLSPSWPSLESE